MTSQHPALILAEQCDLEDVFERMCAAELRRLHAENEVLKAKLLSATKSALDHVQRNRDLEAMLAAVGAGGVGPLLTPATQRQPLTDARIDEILIEAALVPVVPIYKTLARAIEAAHGIKEGV